MTKEKQGDITRTGCVAGMTQGAHREVHELGYGWVAGMAELTHGGLASLVG